MNLVRRSVARQKPVDCCRNGSIGRRRGVHAWALLLGLLLAIGVRGQPGTIPLLPGRAASVAAFVPAGWRIEQQRAADLNGDGRSDLLLLLSPVSDPMGQSDPRGGGVAFSPPRVLAVLLGVKDGFALAASNAKLIPQVDLASQEDPLADGELSTYPGGFDVKLALVAGVGSYLSASLRYRFRHEHDCFRLVGYDRLETHRATLVTEDLSVDFVTGSVVRTSGNAQSDTPGEVQREQLRTKPRRCFQDLGSAANFEPIAR